MLRRVRRVAIVMVAVLSAGWSLVWLARLQPGSNAATFLAAIRTWRPMPGVPGLAVGDRPGPWTLVAADGSAVTGDTLAGRWTLIYFGWTSSPVATPATLQAMAVLADDLADVVPILITVDPARDTPVTMAGYVRLFSPRLIGLSGNAAQIAIAERAFGRAASILPDVGKDDYLQGQNAVIYLVGPDKRLRGVFPAMEEVDRLETLIATVTMTQDLRR